jgi:hypothetical protein
MSVTDLKISSPVDTVAVAYLIRVSVITATGDRIGEK